MTIVASIALISCNNSQNKGGKAENSWEKIYTNAYTNHDYPTAIVALNNLMLTDTANEKHYDSLAMYYLKKTQNFYAGKIMVDKGLALNPNNFQLLEFKSLLMIGEGRFAEARAILEKAYGISKKNKFRYLIATTYANENNLPEFEKMIDGMLASDMPPEKVEAMIDERNSQMVDLRAICFLGKAKVSKDAATISRYIDSTLRIQPDYQEAYYLLEEVKKKSGAQ
jgi:tetratricopeptide (TPR) repeat protein